MNWRNFTGGAGQGARGAKAALALAMLLASLGTSIANIALPTLAEAFQAPFSQVQAVVVAYLAALTIAVLMAGRLGDRFGLKPMLLCGLGLFLAATLACAAAPELWTLVVARAFQGMGAAFLMVLSMALFRQISAEGQIGRAMGLLGTISAVGTALGPTLGGVLIPVAGWRGVFWVQLPIALVALVLTYLLLPDVPIAKRTRQAGFWSVWNWELGASLIVNVLVAAVMMTTLVVGPFYLGVGAGLTPAVAGLVMALGPVISIGAGVPSGRLVDHWGSGRVLAMGLVLLSVGALLLATLPGWIGVAGYAVGIVVLTPGYQLFQAANNTAVLADIPADRRGTVSGLLNLSRNCGLMLGASLMGAIFAIGVGSADFLHASGADVLAGMRLTFGVAGVMMLIALAMVVLRQRAVGKQE